MEHEIWIVFVCPLMMNLIGSLELCVATADALKTVTMVNSFASQWVVRSADDTVCMRTKSSYWATVCMRT